MNTDLVAKEKAEEAQASLDMAERRRHLANVAMTCSAAMLSALENMAGVGVRQSDQ
jgi:hypothetical protein